jgi:hypothetical protein
MHFEKAEDPVVLAEKNKRLQALVGELLKKNEGLRQQLALLQQPAGEPRFKSMQAQSS